MLILPTHMEAQEVPILGSQGFRCYRNTSSDCWSPWLTNRPTWHGCRPLIMAKDVYLGQHHVITNGGPLHFQTPGTSQQASSTLVSSRYSPAPL